MNKNPAGPSFRRLIGTSMAAKLVVDIGSQIFNPFLPIIASGLGLSVVQLGRIVGLRSAVGILAPLSGAISDRVGYRVVIRAALLVMAAGSLLMAASSALYVNVGVAALAWTSAAAVAVGLVVVVLFVREHAGGDISPR